VTPPHTYPGEEIIYVLEGSLDYQIEGQPTKTFNAGDALTVCPDRKITHAGWAGCTTRRSVAEPGEGGVVVRLPG
jgi:uncharacterized cupin superfamily protein